MSKLLAMRYSQNIKGEKNSCSCEACGRLYENPISLTNLSTMQIETYNACPFCFSKQDREKMSNLDRDETPMQILKESTNTIFTEKSKNLETPTESDDNQSQIGCPHHFGYLKKRPKDTSIPETCLTCKKMIQCLL